MEGINKDKLDKLAQEWDGWDDNSDESAWRFTKEDLENAYKAGYIEGFNYYNSYQK